MPSGSDAMSLPSDLYDIASLAVSPKIIRDLPKIPEHDLRSSEVNAILLGA